MHLFDIFLRHRSHGNDTFPYQTFLVFLSGKHDLRRLDILQLDFKIFEALMQKNNFLMGKKENPEVYTVKGNWREVMWLKW